jgi:NADP-dependent 3-hydroxy acid dehydrogenase YdfG
LVPPSQAPSPRSIVGHRDPTEQFYEATSITADDVARIIAFAVGQPRSVSLNEILVRPTAQA